jgi:serine/threonine protein kinase/tetratricopeptide (TPR) repeat protein
VSNARKTEKLTLRTKKIARDLRSLRSLIGTPEDVIRQERVPVDHDASCSIETGKRFQAMPADRDADHGCYDSLPVLDEQIGQYRITGRLGQGGMGEIFSAHDEKLNRTVAVKFIANSRLDSAASRKLFLREARAAASLDHPFICTVHDVLEHGGQPVIIMERVEGETLLERISRGPLGVAEIVRIGTEIAEALAAAHARGVIHRDVKSANIMLTPSGHVKVMDFGLALMTSTSPDDQTAHQSQEVSSKFAGTLPYIAPEVLRGEHASASSDLYALGVVIYEMATGRRPFSGKTDALLMAEILDRRPAPPRKLNPALPRALDELILRALSKDPSRRPTLDDLRSEFAANAGVQQQKRQRSMAVLPFQSLTTDAENAHLGLALADAVTSELALVRSLLVRPTAAILRYQGSPDPITAAHELGVDAVVAGTVQRAGSRLRVTVQLVSAAEERPLWSTKIDATMDDLFAMQDEVSRKIVGALQLELTPAEEQRLGKRVQAAGDVLDLIIRGRVALLTETIANVNDAIENFERAHDLEPRNPLPLLGLSDAYGRLAYTWDPEGGWWEKAKEMCDRALALEPDIPEGRYMRARLAWTPQGGFQHEYAIRELISALSERPNLFEGFDWLATVLFHVGLIEEGREQFERALTISPDDATALSHSIILELLVRNYGQAIRSAEVVVSQVDSSWAEYLAVLGRLHLGDLITAERSIETGARKFPTQVLFHSAGAILAALKGDEDSTRRAIDRTTRNRKPYGHFHHAQFDIGCALALLGRSDEALGWLSDAAHGGFPCLPAVENEPLLEGLRGQSGYRNLVAQLRQTHDHFAAVFGELRKTLTSAS